jgi:hypothetical protein
VFTSEIKKRRNVDGCVKQLNPKYLVFVSLCFSCELREKFRGRRGAANSNNQVPLP